MISLCCLTCIFVSISFVEKLLRWKGEGSYLDAGCSDIFAKREQPIETAWYGYSLLSIIAQPRPQVFSWWVGENPANEVDDSFELR